MDMTINSEFVRKLRTKANWSQEELAAASGLSLRTIQRVENDGTAALETRKALAAAFGLRPENLDMLDPANDPSVQRFGLGMLAFWIGTAWFFDLGLGIGLLGVGSIYLGGCVWRATVDKLPPIWEVVALGLMCFLAGLATLLGFEIRTGAALLIGFGCLLMVSARKR